MAEPTAVPTIITTEKGAVGEPDIRKFDLADLNSRIDAAVKALPADKTIAGFARIDTTGAHIVVVGRIAKGSKIGEFDWTIYGDTPWSGAKPDVGFGLRWSK